MNTTATTTAPILIALLLTLTVCDTWGAAEWPRFRGPDGSGIAAADAKPATTWSGSSDLKWQAALPGPGSSSPNQLSLRSNRFVYCIEAGAGG